MLGTTHAQDRRRPTSAQRSSGLGEGLQVDRRQRRIDRAVGERQHHHDVDERQRQRGLAEEVRHPQVDVAQADDDHQSGDGQWQQAQELHEALGPRRTQPHPDHRRHQDHQHRDDGEHGQQKRDHDRLIQRVVGDQIGPRLQRAAPRDADCGWRSRPWHRAETGRTTRRPPTARREPPSPSPSAGWYPQSSSQPPRGPADQHVVGDHHHGDDDDHLERQCIREARLPEHDLTGQRRADEQRHDRAALTDQRRGGRIRRECIGEQQQCRSQKRRCQQRHGHLAQVLPASRRRD